ncbi:hydroxyacid dehydrogenase [Methylobacterium sp. J-001]|uniref:hydroxyacid dehydrogenase n=1 Tax=Methylobacterium sp. J-001 TaxID=2836609 RepID=UPI001FB95D10|nr:hydroxyacid dehydrogenase [Methylobacterium sp. J-001]MCJ2118731.1 hydroxyacid dehydrogenase [Methylobacterium sp. J-001]
MRYSLRYTTGIQAVFMSRVASYVSSEPSFPRSPSAEPSGVCLIVQPIHAAGLARLRAAGLEHRIATDLAPATLAREAADCVAVITRNGGFPAEAVLAAPRLRVIGVHGTGTDPVAVLEATRVGIPVVNTPGANAQSVAEHAIGLIFALAKAIPQADRAMREGDHDFRYGARLVELAGLTLGLVGFGAIGQATGRLAAALGMEVLAYGPTRPASHFEAIGAERATSLPDLLARADVVSLHLPLTPLTRGLIGSGELTRMKAGAFLINTARGALVDEGALAKALAAGTIAGAGLDVVSGDALAHDHPLHGERRAILTPHVAASTEAALIRAAERVAGQVVDVLAGRRPPNLVNAEVWNRRRQGEPSAEFPA